jgi:nucleoid-associated protein YgaU
MFGRILIIALVSTVAWAVLAHSSSGAGKPQHYVVKPTDTLWSIAAARYGGDPRDGVWKLEQANRLQDAKIVPGEKLLLP